MSRMRDMYVGIYFEDNASRAINNLDRAMDSVENRIAGLGRQLDGTSNNFRSVSRVGTNSLNNIGVGLGNVTQGTNQVNTATSTTAQSFSSVQTIGVGAWTAIGASVTSVAAGIGALVTEYDTAMSRMEAKTALTGAELESVQSTIENVFNAGVGTDLTTVSDDIVRIQNALQGLEGSELESFSKNAITMSDLWGESTDNVVWTVKNMTSNFDGLSESAALDILTVSFKETGDYAGDLLDTFKEYSPYFADMGLSAQEFANILIGSEGAWNLDKVGDAVKEFGISAIDGSKSTSEAFKDIGLDADHMASAIASGGDSANQAFYATLAGLAAIDDEVKRNEIGVALFKTQWEDLSDEVVLGMTEAKNATREFEGAAEQATSTALDNFGTNMTSAFREFKTEVAGIFASGEGSNALNMALTGISTVLDGAIVGLTWVVDNGDTIIAITAGIVGGFAAFSILTTASAGISAVSTALTVYRTAGLAAAAAQLGLNTAMLASPLTWIAVGIGAVIAAGILLYQNWDTVKAKASELWSATTEKFAGIKQSVSDFVQPAIGWFESIGQKWDNFKSSISNFKVPKWMSSIGGMIGSATSWVASKVDGSHATGLERVPFDGYTAELHKNEAVLTAGQSNLLRSAGILRQGSGGKPEVNLSSSQPQVTVQSQNNAIPAKANHNTVYITIHAASDKAQDIKRAVNEALSDILDDNLQVI
ncbi:phage tail tape measure protein [Lysinibacillus sp. KU-BSD001]|uniref:phage tail tape measure protein n=1 Tax=Lysinibacillus sp. KU-BSD001 TaxID=3141328 RepID=UPI0036E13519